MGCVESEGWGVWRARGVGVGGKVRGVGGVRIMEMGWRVRDVEVGAQ